MAFFGLIFPRKFLRNARSSRMHVDRRYEYIVAHASSVDPRTAYSLLPPQFLLLISCIHRCPLSILPYTFAFPFLLHLPPMHLLLWSSCTLLWVHCKGSWRYTSGKRIYLSPSIPPPSFSADHIKRLELSAFVQSLVDGHSSLHSQTLFAFIIICCPPFLFSQTLTAIGMMNKQRGMYPVPLFSVFYTIC